MDQFVTAIEQEVKRWPGTTVEVKPRRKHRAAVLRYGSSERSVIIPTTGSDHRGPKNALSEVRRTLKKMGAVQLARPPASKREEQAVAVVARIGVNQTSVIFSVPTTSSIYSQFVKDGESKFFWSMELRANADLKGTPYLAIVKKPQPEGKIHPGIGRGCVNKPTGRFSLAVFRKQFKAIDRMGPFASQPIELHAVEGDTLLFKLPANRKPLSRRPDKKVEPRPEPEVMAAEIEIAPPPQPAPRATAPEPEPAAQHPTPLVIQAPKEKVSLEKAINVINAYKEKMGDNLRLSIAEGGYLAVIAKMGRR